MVLATTFISCERTASMAVIRKMIIGASTATVAPVRKPAPPPSRWRSVAALLALVLLALAALFLGRAGTIDVPIEVRYGVIAVAVALLGWRIVARRR